jgi:hypothetical protein
MSQSAKDSYPIVLLDCSGSTEHSIDLTKYFKNNDIDSVLKYEINTAQRILKSKGITHAYVIMWNFTGIILSQDPILVSEFTKIRTESLGGTCLSKGLEVIPEEWIKVNGKEKKELYIFTDGEIEDEDAVVTPLKKLIDSGLTIHIVTIEPNNTNYIQTKGEAGQKLFQIIKINGLTRAVRRFSSYNEHHVFEPFISFDNPEAIEGFTPFQGKQYNIAEQQDELLDAVEQTIAACETKEDVVKVAHELTNTIHHITKDKAIEDQIEINNQFADLFADSTIDPSLFIQVNKLLLIEAGNHTNGAASSFHEFKDAMILYSANK